MHFYLTYKIFYAKLNKVCLDIFLATPFFNSMKLLHIFYTFSHFIFNVLYKRRKVENLQWCFYECNSLYTMFITMNYLLMVVHFTFIVLRLEALLCKYYFPTKLHFLRFNIVLIKRRIFSITFTILFQNVGRISFKITL